MLKFIGSPPEIARFPKDVIVFGWTETVAGKDKTWVSLGRGPSVLPVKVEAGVCLVCI